LSGGLFAKKAWRQIVVRLVLAASSITSSGFGGKYSRKDFKKTRVKEEDWRQKIVDFQACLVAAHPPRSLLAAVFKKDFWRQCTRRTFGGKFNLAASNKDYLLGGAS